MGGMVGAGQELMPGGLREKNLLFSFSLSDEVGHTWANLGPRAAYGPQTIYVFLFL